MESFNIEQIISSSESSDVPYVANYLREIAKSIKCVKEFNSIYDDNNSDSVSDPDCIISGTVLQKYIGPSKEIILPKA